MKKIAFLLIGILMAATSVLRASGDFTDNPAAQPEQYTPKGLPDVPLTMIDGNKLNTKDLDGKVVLVLFQPDCDHCQREAVEIREHLTAFDDYSMYFITYAPLTEIQRFAQEYELGGIDNVFFAYAEVQPILDNFGSIPTPSLYIYSEEKGLVKAFEGETPLSNILPHL